mmetsp:Transcript_95942/g.140192  ORF Transcript_95942/g.140192 Transcript_95942/m.140192 type:complete len:131 (-) Transcript_95942:173-565(-)
MNLMLELSKRGPTLETSVAGIAPVFIKSKEFVLTSTRGTEKTMLMSALSAGTPVTGMRIPEVVGTVTVMRHGSTSDVDVKRRIAVFGLQSAVKLLLFWLVLLGEDRGMLVDVTGAAAWLIRVTNLAYLSS